MGIIVTKENEESSQLSERITADLRERAAKSSNTVVTDFSEEDAKGKTTEKTGKFSWFWFGLVALAAVSMVFILL